VPQTGGPLPSLPAEAEVVVAVEVPTAPWGSPLPEGPQSQGLSRASPDALVLLILRLQAGCGKAVPGLHHAHHRWSPWALGPKCAPENPGVSRQSS